MAAEGDFLTRYRAVSNKLKKRFLRKPNVAEASEQFGQLAKELKQQDCPQYAAFCNLAMARCEQTLFNAPGEALALTDAARLFLASEQETRALRAPGFDENMQEHHTCRDDKNVADQRPGWSDEVILDEDAESTQLYTALQYKSSSIYDAVHLDVMHEEYTKKTSDEKNREEQEDEVFDLVYENVNE